MNKISTFLILSCAAFMVSGCLVIRTGKKCPPQGGPAVVFPGDQDPVIEEINAVGKLNMSSDRERLYTQIAKRDPLSEPAQIVLVKTAYRNLHMSTSKVNLLLTLIANPSFSPGAKSAILRDINKLHMSSDKTKVLDAIGKRGPLKPVAAPVPPPAPVEPVFVEIEEVTLTEIK